MSRIVQPSVRETAFSCPHCSALTTQQWYTLYAKQIDDKNRLPLVACDQMLQSLKNDREMPEKRRDLLLNTLKRIDSGLVFLEEATKDLFTQRAYNVHLSKCYNCGKLALWVHDRLLFPNAKGGVPPNPDLPDGIVRDFEEAREIVGASPRGAAALLRLCIQKLCQHLGEKGKNIDDDIASLVKKGLQPLVQQSLDIVRVIGNEAVHPGVMDLKDDQDTALRLFDLVNAITQQMISHPRVVGEMYAKLPEAKRKAIETRDKK
jgi:hypothetical protein